MTSTDWTVYNDDTKRTQYSTVPTSNITAETVVVDGFALSQKDTVGITTSAARSFTASGMVLTQTDSLLAGGKTHLITETRDTMGRSTGYTYAKDGSTQQTVTTGYGTDGRITTAGFMHGGAEKQFSYEYLPGTNLLQKLTLPSNMTLTQEYEPKRDLLTGMHYKRSSTSLVQRTYTYDALGRLLTRSTARNNQTVTDSFGYNTRSELTSATVNNGSYGYAYDNIGNRTTAQENAEEITSYQSNALNQYAMLTVDDITDFIPSYDEAGNQTRVKTATGIWAVSYDAQNRPTDFTKIDSSGSTSIHCEYDYMGRRATKKVTTNGSITLHQRYIYRGYLQIAALDLTRAAHPALWYITWDPTQPVATRPLAIQLNGTWYTYGWDLTKNICEVFGPAGYIRTAYTYTPYGEVSATGDVTQPIQWSSEYNDTETALVYYNYRHYNPVDGRWIGRDFVPDKQMSEYAFLGNALFRAFDYLGLKKTDNFFGHNEKDFRDWYHRQVKQKGMPDAKTKRQMDRHYEEWKRSGCPDGELNKRGSGARERNRGKHNKEKRGYYDDDDDDYTPPSSTIYEQEEIVGGHEDDYAQEDAYDWRAVAVGSLDIVASIAIVVATIAEDVGTGGVGIINDIPSFAAAGSLIARGASTVKSAIRFAKSAPRHSPALKPALTY